MQNHPDSEGRCCCHLRFACCQWCDYRYYQEGYEKVPLKKVNVSVKTLEWSPKFDLMNAAEYIKYNDIAYNEAIKDGIATVNSTQKHSQYDTNWQDEVLKTACSAGLQRITLPVAVTQ